MSAGACLLLAALVLSVVPDIGATGGPGCELMWDRRSLVPGARVVDSALSDLDGDGRADLLLWGSGRDGPWWMVALDGRTGDVLWSRNHVSRPSVRVGTPGSGVPGVFVATARGLEVVHGSTGDLVLRCELHGEPVGVALGDVDGDGGQDVVVSSGDLRNDRLCVLSGAEARPLFDVDAVPDDSRFGDGFGRPVIADADGDGRGEIYLAENSDSVAKIDPDGSRAWSVALDERAGRIPKGAVTGGPVIADVTGDGLSDVSVGCLAGRLLVLAAGSGDTLAAARFGVHTEADLRRMTRLPGFIRDLVSGCGEPVNGLLATELDGRPGLELVFGCSDGRLRAYAPASGRELWSLECGGQVYDTPLALDWNADGAADVVAWHDDAVILVDGRTGRPMHGLPPIAAPSAVLIGDLDGDGRLELVAVERGAGRVTAWRTGLGVDAAR